MTAPSAPAYSTPSAPVGGTFYVVLHGLMGIIRRPNGLEILIPDMGTKHVYRAGACLGETTIHPSPAPYHLTHITGGSADFDPSKTLTINSIPPCGQPQLYARITLPLPAWVYHVGQIDLSTVITDPGNHLPSKIATSVHVLKYYALDFRLVRFGCDAVDIPFVTGQDGVRYVLMHIYAEEDKASAALHTPDGFAKLCSVFDFPCPPTFNAKVDLPSSTSVGDVPPGITWLDIMNLASRTELVAFWGWIIRQQILQGGAPVVDKIAAAVGTDPATCTPIVCRLP
jgi:hypothetical protein